MLISQSNLCIPGNSEYRQMKKGRSDQQTEWGVSDIGREDRETGEPETEKNNYTWRSLRREKWTAKTFWKSWPHHFLAPNGLWRQLSQVWGKLPCTSWPSLAPHKAASELSPQWTWLKLNIIPDSPISTCTCVWEWPWHHSSPDLKFCQDKLELNYLTEQEKWGS